METVLSGMISNLALPQGPAKSATSAAELPAHQMEAGTPTPPNSTSATSPATNSSTPGAIYPIQQQPQMMISPIGVEQQQHSNGNQPQQQQQRSNRTFFRPPGLGPEGPEGDEPFPTNVQVCPHCGFSCSSKFHYNSHMNTHTTHKCPMCTYQSRTEGRLKKHIQQSHTHEQRVAAGICISPTPATLPPTVGQQQNSPRCIEEQSPRGINNGNAIDNGGNGNVPIIGSRQIPTTIAPLLNSMLSDNTPINGLESTLQSMLNNTNPLAQFSNSTDALLKICTDAISNNGPNEKTYNSPQMGDLGPTALDQLRALAERQAANLLATSTANALGFVGDLNGTIIGGMQEDGGIGGEPKKAETPRRSGKPKQYKCKQCQHVSRSKKEQWAHARLHIPKQKQLTCELCDFVTEYKHHLEYHYRNHNGQKPFKCNTCAYTCVNKSMLNSHMKSHTPIYQFRCQDCTYQTKYCHSLKMHLKKYAHKRAPGAGGSDSSGDSHGEERPENASSSSVGKDESFENGGSTQEGANSGGEMGEGVGMDLGEMIGQSAEHSSSTLLMAQPIVGSTTSEMEMASQRFMLQQQLQLEQMNELIRNAVVNCPHCAFSTGNIDDMNRHLLFHLIATQQQMPPLSNEQQALASIYQRIAAQLQQELSPEGQMLGQPPPPSELLIGHNNNNNNHLGTSNGEIPMDLEKARQMERELAESIRREHRQQGGCHPPTTTIAALLEGTTMEANSQMGECCNNEATPSSSSAEPGPSNSSTFVNGNQTKKEFSGHHNHRHFGTETGNGNEQQQIENETTSSSSSQSQSQQMASGTCVIKNVLPHLHGHFEQRQNGTFGQNNLLNNFPNRAQFLNNLPFYCQQCEIAFKNAVLYQLHCGYHSIESPFKCNRCGHLSSSALEFNLHLYQAKHE